MSFIQDFGFIIVGALIFIISFIWKDFLTDFQEVFISSHPSLLQRFIFISVLTVIVIFIVILLRQELGISNSSSTDYDSGKWPQFDSDSDGNIPNLDD